MQNLKSKYLRFHFEIAEGQNTKIPSKYQNLFEVQNAKISAVSTPISTTKEAFSSIFQALEEKYGENASKPQKSRETFAPKFGFFLKKAQNFDEF